MGWSRGTALVDVATFKNLAMQAGVAKLNVGTDLDVAEGLLAASDTIYDQVAQDLDPTTIVNFTAYQRPVAEFFLATLCRRRLIAPPPGRQAPAVEFEWSDPYLRRIQPQVAVGDAPRFAGEGLPVDGHLSPGLVFSGDITPFSDQDYFTGGGGHMPNEQ